jgi:Ca2+-transporting ATPase
LFYKQTLEEIYIHFQSTEVGLSSDEAKTRLNSYGPNQLDLRKDSIWKIIIEPFRSVFVAVLLFAALVSIFSHEPIDAIVVLAIVVLNAIIFYTQHYATTRVVRGLKKHSIQKVSVYRDGVIIEVSSVDLVPGDAFIVNEGERIPADARIINCDNLQLNESSLTGESTPVHKISKTLNEALEIYEQRNMLFQGTFVTSGTATAIAVNTGNQTEFGKIASLATEENSRSSLQIKIDKLISVIVKSVAVASVLVFALAIARDIPASEALRFVLSLSVAAVPEGLPVALTIITVLGMKQMAKHKALVKSFKSIEDVGLITTIATDKTGTLTKNKLSIVDSWSIGTINVENIARLSIDASDKAKDPLDIAINESIAGDSKKLEKIYPFDVNARVSGAYSNSESSLYIKGSPEQIIEISDLTNKQKEKIHQKVKSFTSKGYRVIAFGIANNIIVAPKSLKDIDTNKLNFAGVIAFADELRPESKIAVSTAQNAGINVRLITGDHIDTAYTIGNQVGIATSREQAIQGSDLPADTKSFAATVASKTIYARILPKDKFRILKQLKKTEITAMTGDGVNDVPALSDAHVGFAMGSGSDIAKDASGIVLLDDNFATITNAIAEGRKIFSNIQKMLFYLLSTSLGGVITMIGALLFGLPLPVTALQILWVNLVTDTALVLPLGLEKAEDGIMNRPPRDPKAPLLSKALVTRMLLVSATMAIAILAIVVVLRSNGQSVAYIQTTAFMALIVAQWTNALNARSEYESALKSLLKPNYGMLFGFFIAFFLQMIVMFGPLRSAFEIQTVPLTTLLYSSGIMAISILAVSEIHKRIASTT